MNPEELKALMEQILGQVKTTVEATVKPINERLDGLDGKLKAQPQPTPTPTPTPIPQPTPTPTPGSGLTPEVNALLQERKRETDELTKKLADMAEERKKADERAAQAEQRSVIERSLSTLTTGGYSFASDNARRIAEQIMSGAVKRDESGTLIAGDNLPVEAFAKTLVDDHAYLFAAPAVGGSGAGPSGSIRPAGTKQVQIESIRPGMSVEERAQVIEAIKAATPR